MGTIVPIFLLHGGDGSWSPSHEERLKKRFEVGSELSELYALREWYRRIVNSRDRFSLGWRGNREALE